MNSKIISTLLDDSAILSSLISISNESHLSEEDMGVLAAFRRYSDETQDIDSIREYLQNLSDDQISGVVNNVKGILHEMQYVEIENSDDDHISAILFPNTNHQAYDVLTIDEMTGSLNQIQIKSTDSPSYVQEWIHDHPNGEILLSEEIATELQMPSTGLSNQEMTMNVNDFIEKILAMDSNSQIFNLFPTLAITSLAILIYQLFKRYRNGEISMEKFKTLVLKTTGMKIFKFSALLILLAIPGVNVVVGAGLVAQILLSLPKIKQSST